MTTPEQTYCSECHGGWANPIHGPGDPLTGHHEFQYERPTMTEPLTDAAPALPWCPSCRAGKCGMHR